MDALLFYFPMLKHSCAFSPYSEPRLRYFIYLFIFSQGEGVAYRGRVLVELATTLNEDIKQATGPLASEDIIAAQVGGSSLNNV